jgi:8-oxo-dGTP pyrophosphatase MutT (NUDIX family)
MELWDLLDKDRIPLGKTHPRGREYPMPEGTYHLVVYVMTVDTDGRILLTRRSEKKRSYPGYWEFTGGSAVAGEDSLTAVRRELAEETGLDMPEKGITLLTSLRVPEAFADVYLARTGAPAESVTVTLQEGETSESQWVTLHEFEELLRTGLVPPTLAMVYGTVRAQVIDATGGEI